jgi:PAS domain S-box-containing protein
MGAFCREAHVSMWACDEDFRIVLWNKGAEELYDRSADSVLGERYDTLFIDEAEREQSLADCRKIIREGARFRNFLALDVDSRGRQKQMLTNCFRITDPETGQHYQAEIGLDIAELELAQTELRTLREVGLRNIVERDQTLKIRKEHIAAAVADLEKAVATHAEERTDQVDAIARGMSRRLKSQSAEPYQRRKAAIAEARDAIVGSLRSLAQQVESADDLADIAGVESELPERRELLKRVDDAEASAT